MSRFSIVVFVRSVLMLLALQASFGFANSLTDTSGQTASFNHQPWDQLLKQHVKTPNKGVSSSVNYAGMATDNELLKKYLASLSAVSQAQFDDWGKNTQLAFLINAYNAFTVELILQAYPDLESIKDLGSFFSPPWSKSFFKLLGEKHSLNDIEHDLIRGSNRYNDPRIHFAVNCASIGCPALRPQAYNGPQLDQQLTEQTQLFLSDASRNRLKNNNMEVSSIFKWYQEDFEHGWQGIHSLSDLFAQHASEMNLSKHHVQLLKKDDIDIKFLDYDWSLNDSKPTDQ